MEITEATRRAWDAEKEKCVTERKELVDAVNKAYIKIWVND